MVKAAGIMVAAGVVTFCVAINIHHIKGFFPVFSTVFTTMVKAIFSI